MESRVKLLGHPVHQIAVAFPMGLLCTAALFDALYVLRGDPKWSDVAFFMISGGLAGGTVAAIFGLIDYIAIPSGTRAKRIARFHGLASLAVVVLFALSWAVRSPSSLLPPPPLALLFSFSGAAVLCLAGWLGGELLNRMGVGVDDGAHLNAGNSLAGPVSVAGPAAVPDIPDRTGTRTTHQ